MSAADFRGEVIRGDDWRFADLRGRRVAVIASGAEAARIVPQVVRTASSVKVFQSNADWVLPSRVTFPLLVGPVRRTLARLHLRWTVRDAWTRRQLTPYDGYSGRPAVSRTFYPALQRGTVKLVTWPVYALTEHGVRSAEGIEHRVDCIILGAGLDFPGKADRKERIA